MGAIAAGIALVVGAIWFALRRRRRIGEPEASVRGQDPAQQREGRSA